jgi:hypothetical protein
MRTNDQPDQQPVIVLGDVMTDLIVRTQAPIAVGSDTPSRIETHAGGAGANLAVWLARASRSTSSAASAPTPSAPCTARRWSVRA